MTDHLLTVPEAAQGIRSSEWAVRRMLRSGELRGSLVAGKWLVSESDLAAYVASKANVAPPSELHRRRRRRSA